MMFVMCKDTRSTSYSRVPFKRTGENTCQCFLFHGCTYELGPTREADRSHSTANSVKLSEYVKDKTS